MYSTLLPQMDSREIILNLINQSTLFTTQVLMTCNRCKFGSNISETRNDAGALASKP